MFSKLIKNKTKRYYKGGARKEGRVAAEQMPKAEVAVPLPLGHSLTEPRGCGSGNRRCPSEPPSLVCITPSLRASFDALLQETEYSAAALTSLSLPLLSVVLPRGAKAELLMFPHPCQGQLLWNGFTQLCKAKPWPPGLRLSHDLVSVVPMLQFACTAKVCVPSQEHLMASGFNCNVILILNKIYHKNMLCIYL